MLGTSGLLAAYSVEGLLVALPTELMAHIIFMFSCLRLRSSCGPLLLQAFSMMPGASGLLAAFSVEELLVALPTELMAHIIFVFIPNFMYYPVLNKNNPINKKSGWATRIRT
ncbi:hypothetical protein [Virgibacillus halodenitrificans]|uniref:hypothetical protein n=1 Tax=Virgibacillus halodenitrificans TaxID=1482 RepID=UPI00098633C2|nr:hypothetical protein [Virgibacillus halodenitrificans]